MPKKNGRPKTLKSNGRYVKRYMDKHGITQDQFAEMLGVTQSLVSQWITGRKRVSPEQAPLIEQKTGGEVRRSDLHPQLWAA